MESPEGGRASASGSAKFHAGKFERGPGNAPPRSGANGTACRPSEARYADVALDLPGMDALSYQVPSALEGHAAVGQRVQVPLRNGTAVGCIISLAQTTAFPRVKPIQRLLDDQPVLTPDLIQLSGWMARTYCAGRGEALAAMLPGPLRRGRPLLAAAEGEVVPTIGTAEPLAPPPTLTAQQAAADAKIREALTQRRHEVFLLHGVTSSGKTEVYLQAIQQALAQGLDSIVLVPEIALTPQTIERFTHRCGAAQVAVLHSRLRERQRLSEWSRIAQGRAHVVIGARSAVFAPTRHLGLIVVDEEQENTYKQEETPRYHARDTAVERARVAGAVVVLGGATPSLEAYTRAQAGRYTLLTLTERIDRQPLPAVEVVDLRRLAGRGARAVVSPQLETALGRTLADHQQAILFLNRRGFATFIQCRGCGVVARCPACQVALTFHQATGQLLCHHCRHREPAPDLCPACHSQYVRFRGAGTQRVESELARRFPTARIARMDTDTMRPRASHEAVLSRFRRHELDILIGTQMVAKGHDFPQVTMIGIINADTALHLPDFRAAERTFDLLTQVAGRAGRGTMPGRVIIQTALPDHPAIVYASRHDYDGFYREELGHRKALHLPPVAAMARLTVRATREDRAKTSAETLAAQLQRTRKPTAMILGPSPAHLYRLRGDYRWHVIVTAKTLDALLARLAPVRAQRRVGGAQVTIDVDPWSPW